MQSWYQGTSGRDQGQLAGLVLQRAAGVLRRLARQLLDVELAGRLGDDRAVRRDAPGVGGPLAVPLAGHVGRADRHDALLDQRIGVGRGEGAGVGEDVELLGRLDGVGIRRLLPAADDLLGRQAAPLPQDGFDLAAVELERGVEVVEEAEGGALEVLPRLVDAVVGEELVHLAEVDGVGREAEADPDGLLGDAPGSGAAVVAGEGEARRRVRVLGDLPGTIGTGRHGAEWFGRGGRLFGTAAGVTRPDDPTPGGRPAGTGRGRPSGVRRRPRRCAPGGHDGGASRRRVLRCGPRVRRSDGELQPAGGHR